MQKSETKSTKRPRKTRAKGSARAARELSGVEAIQQLADAMRKPVTGEKFVGVRNISNDVIGVPNPVKGQPDLLALHTEFVDSVDPTRFVSNPNACQVVPHAVWMQLRRGPLFDRGMIVRDDSILGDSYEAAPADDAKELAAGWAKNAVLDPTTFIERSERELRLAVDAMTSEQSLKRLLTAVNQRIEKERRAIQANGEPEKEERALRNMPAIYHLAEELVLGRLSTLGYR